MACRAAGLPVVASRPARHLGGRRRDDVFSVYLRGRDLSRLPVQAGQFLTWRFPGRPGWSRANPYSLSAAPDGHSLRITVKELGDGSRSLRALRPGTRAVVEGPFGRLTERPRTQRRVLLIGAGVGITPLRSLAEGLGYAPGEATVLYRYSGTPLFGAEWDRLARERGLRVVALPGPRRSSDSWLTAHAGSSTDVEALQCWVPDLKSTTSTCADRLRGRTPCVSPPCRPACLQPSCMSRPSDGDQMRRILLWGLSTLTVLVLLLGYRTSLSGPEQLVATPVVAISRGSSVPSPAHRARPRPPTRDLVRAPARGRPG